MAKDAFQKLKNILWNNKLSMVTRKRILECYVKPILMYGSECWTISPQMEQRLQAAEMWLYRKMLRISWKDRVRNTGTTQSRDT